MNIDFSFVSKHYAARTHEKMKEVLMDPQGVGPAIHYYMIRGGVKQHNITVWEPGTVSGEYIKTYGHYHVGNLDETYQVLFGQGIALLQKLASNPDGSMINDVVEEFKVIPCKAGDEIYMPPGWGHLVVNTSETYFATADTSPVNFDEAQAVSMPGHADYKPVQEMQGFAYYVIEHEGKPALKQNMKYKEIRKTEANGIPIL